MMDGPMHPQTEPVPLRNARRGTCDGVTSSRFSAARRPLGPSWRARSSRRRRSSALSAQRNSQNRFIDRWAPARCVRAPIRRVQKGLSEVGSILHHERERIRPSTLVGLA